MSTSKIPQTSTTKSTTSSSNLIPISRKRTPRQRNPVVLLQDQYSQIYATHNNRKIKPTQPKHSSSKLQNPGLPASAIINETANKQNKDHKSSSIISHSLQKTTRLPPTYRWIGNSIIESDGNTYYEKLEIKVGNHASLISVGDSVLLSSGDLEEDELFCKPDASSPLTQQGGNIGNKLSKASSIKNLASSANKNATEISKIESLVNEIAINSLNPYVALVDSIFEEPLTEIEKSVCNSENNKRRKKNDIVSYTEQRRTRMKIRAKWYFKKEDVAGLGGDFVPFSRQHILSSMTARDLLLGDQRDDNEVSAILGKCRVIRCRPSDLYPSNLNGVFICRYDITLTAPTSNSRKGIVKISSYERSIDLDEKNGEISAYQRPLNAWSSDTICHNKHSNRVNETHSNSKQSFHHGQTERIVTSSSQTNIAAMECDNLTAMVKEENNGELRKVCSHDQLSFNDDILVENYDYSSDDSLNQNQNLENTAPITEGNTTVGKIHVGVNHQASIPGIIYNQNYSSLRSQKPSTVWRHSCISDAKLESYLVEGGNILKEYMMKEYGAVINMKRHITSLYPTYNNEGNVIGSRKQQLSKECNIDSILRIFYEQKFNRHGALSVIKNSPEEFLTLWSREEKELFNIGFQNHFNNLHLVGKAMGSIKNHKEVVDYYYRFKIPDQFQRFEDKKREQAHRMMICIEERRSKLALVDRSEDSPTPVGFWATTGCNNGPHSIKSSRNRFITENGKSNRVSAVENRRLHAKEFLIHVRNTIGAEKYLLLVTHLKDFQSRSLDISNMTDAVTNILKSTPDLLQQFKNSFLPKPK